MNRPDFPDTTPGGSETGTWLVIRVRGDLGLWQGTRIRSCESMRDGVNGAWHLLIAEWLPWSR